MSFFASLVLVLLFALGLNTSVSRHSLVWYGIAIIFLIFEWFFYSLGLWHSFPDWFSYQIMNLFVKNSFSTAFFTLVMYAGILKSSWTVTQKIKKIRGELAILGCYFSLGHNLIYGKYYFVNLFINHTVLETHEAIATLVSLVMVVMMLVLMLTSFQWVRRKMNPSTWKRIQRMAYPFFALLYIHVIVLFIPKAHERWFSIITYTIVFVGYFVVKLTKMSSAQGTGNILKADTI